MENKSTDEIALPPINLEALAESAASTETEGSPTVELNPVPVTWPPSTHYQDPWDSKFQPDPLPRQRPVGVTVISILSFIGATLIGFVWLGATSQKVDLGILAIVWPLDVILLFAAGSEWWAVSVCIRPT
jgi:hypothetical protein